LGKVSSVWFIILALAHPEDLAFNLFPVCFLC